MREILEASGERAWLCERAPGDARLSCQDASARARQIFLEVPARHPPPPPLARRSG
jgi:hypothetical protein